MEYDNINLHCHHCGGFVWHYYSTEYNSYTCCGCGRPRRTDRIGKRPVTIRVDGRDVERWVDV